jgi:hypothetical protein
MLSNLGLAGILCLKDSGFKGFLYDKATLKKAFAILTVNDSQFCPIGVVLII